MAETPRNQVQTHDPRASFSPEQIARIESLKRPPRKYADASRTTLRDEWRIWEEAHRWDEEELSKLQLSSLGGNANVQVYYPEDYDKDLGDGTWVFVIDPPTNVALDFEVPLLSLWWARPHVMNVGKYGNRLPYQGIIQTPAGDLHLWPHEYTICHDVEGIIGEEGTYIHTLGGQPLLDEERLFYLMSRGIPQHEATLLLFKEINQPNYCYVTLHDDLVDVFAGVGTHLPDHVRSRWLSRNAEASS